MEWPYLVDIYSPTGTDSVNPYTLTFSQVPCNVEPHKYSWRHEVAQMGQQAGRVYKLTLMTSFNDAVLNIYDHQRVTNFQPATPFGQVPPGLTGTNETPRVFEIQMEADDTNRPPLETSIEAYQTANIKETQGGFQ